MASVYEIVCKTCGARWDWYKYGEPDEQCPECGAELTVVLTTTVKVKPYPYRNWNPDKVIVFGVGSTGLDIEEAVKKIKGEKK